MHAASTACSTSPWVRRLTAALVCSLLGLSSLLAHQPHDPISSVAVSPGFGQDRTVFTATEVTSINMSVYLVLKSTDAGHTWSVTPFPNIPATCVLISPDYQTDQTLFVGTSEEGVLRSRDGGESWEPLGDTSGMGIRVLAVSPGYATDGTLFLVNSSNQIHATTDGGDSWTQVANFSPLPGRAIQTLALSPTYPADGTLFLGTRGRGVFRSTDAGASWRPVNNGLAGLNVQALAVNAGAGGRLQVFAGTQQDGFFASTNGGLSWSPLSQGLTDLDVTGIAVAPRLLPISPLVLFVSTRSEGVFKSENGGALWGPTGVLPRPLSAQDPDHFRSLAISPAYASDQSLFVAMFEGLWRSDNGGLSWHYSDILPGRLVRGLALSPDHVQDGTLAISTYGSGILVSTDGGENWETRNTGLANSYTDHIEISPNFAVDRIITTGIFAGLEKSTDGGETWVLHPVLDQDLFIRAQAYSPAFSQDNILVVGSNNSGRRDFFFDYGSREIRSSGIWLSVDGGDNWVPSLLNGVRVFSLATSPGYPADGVIFAGIGEDLDHQAGVYRSISRGIKWTRMNTEPFDRFVTTVVVSPGFQTDQIVLAGTRSGVIQSSDGGVTWSLSPGTEGWEVTALALSPGFPADPVLYAGTLRHGVQGSWDGGASWSPLPVPGRYVTEVGVSPGFQVDQTLFAATYQGLFRSGDAGSTWEKLNLAYRSEESENPRMRYTPNWSGVLDPAASTSHFVVAGETGAKARFDFVASSVAWIGSRGPNHGIAQVFLDDVLVGQVDLYAPGPQRQQVLYDSGPLPLDPHTVVVVVTGTRNPASSNTLVAVDAFDITY